MEKPDRIIFLDIDGVLTNAVMHPIAWVRRKSAKWQFWEEPIELLKHLCEKTGAKIVVVSTRLKTLGPEKAVSQLMDAGIPESMFYDPRNINPLHCKHPIRAQAIAEFCRNPKGPGGTAPAISPENYIIIDDNIKGYSPDQMARLVQPMRRLRFTKANLEKALSYFAENAEISVEAPELSTDWTRRAGHSRAIALAEGGAGR